MAAILFAPFAWFYPEQAELETRVLQVRGHPDLPDDNYALQEAYCSDSGCDCDLVLLSVFGERSVGPLANIWYRIDQQEDRQVPYLDPGDSPSKHLAPLLDLVSDVLANRDYYAPIERHYRDAKRALSDPSNPIHAWLAREAQGQTVAPEKSLEKTGDADPRTSIPLAAKSDQAPRSTKKGSPEARPRAESVPTGMLPWFAAIVGLTDIVCKEYLDDEYRQLCRELTAALCRKRPSPLTQGKLEAWACGIVHAIGSVNFLFDKTQMPYLSVGDLCQIFGVSMSASSAKARAIKKMLRMYEFDPRWTRPSQFDSSPFAWLIKVDGLLVDARALPRDLQEKAFRRGLIPYVPGDGSEDI